MADTFKDTGRSLRVAVLAHNLRAAGGLSVGKNVLAALGRVAGRHEYWITVPAGAGYESVAMPPRAQCEFVERRGGWLGQWSFEGLALRTRVRAFRPDLVWGLGNFGLRRPPCRQAVLVHKPHYLYGPEFQKTELRRYRWVNAIGRRRLRRCLPATQLVFCQTQTACDRFRRTFSYAGRLCVLPNAVSQAALEGCSQAAPRAFERLRGRFVLFCLTKYYAHKNLESLAELFERHAPELADVAVLLTVRREDHPLAPRFLARIERGLLPKHLINVGLVPQTELAAYYAHCQGLILPTRLESFSGTYLEAMQFGRPILTSDLDFAREVCGPAARYFDPLDPASIRDAILELKTSPSLSRDLIAAGRERMGLFFRDWDSIVADAMRELEALVE